MKTIDVSNLTQEQLDGYFVLSAEHDDGLALFWLEAGASIEDNEEALLYAIENDNEALVDKLLKLNVDVNAYVDGKPLWFYSLSDMKYFNKFLELGIDVNAKGHDGTTALEIVYFKNNQELADKLIEMGIDVNELMSKEMTLITFNMIHHYHRDTDVCIKWFDKLINAGADINKNSIGKYGDPVIYWLLTMGYEELIDKALEAGIDVNCVAPRNNKHVLMRFDEYDTIEKLIRYGADVNAQDIHGRTVLMYHILGENKRCVELLLKNGADPRIADENGMTPLNQARMTGEKEIIKLIKQYLKK